MSNRVADEAIAKARARLTEETRARREERRRKPNPESPPCFLVDTAELDDPTTVDEAPVVDIDALQAELRAVHHDLGEASVIISNLNAEVRARDEEIARLKARVSRAPRQGMRAKGRRR